ncbi:MAG: stage III sporulation protein AB [Syntrophomonas sp.]
MLWLKTVGIACIISGFGGWGLNGAQNLERRVEQIKELRLALGFLEKEVGSLYIPLSRALGRTAQFCKMPVAVLFSASARILEAKAGATGSEAWMKGLEELQHSSKLKKPEIELLAAAASQLGMTDAAQQKKLLSLLQEELGIMEAKALQEAEAGHKLWSYGGFMFGALIVLLLL